MKNNVLYLNPFYALFRPYNAVYFLIYALGIGLMYRYVNDMSKLPFLILFTVIAVGYRIYVATRYLEFKRDTVLFVYTHHVGTGKHRKAVKVKYTLTNVTDLKFEQNPVEKLFGAGHISFSGRVFGSSESLYFDQVTLKNSFTFYGIPSIRQNRKEICNILGVNETE